MKTILAALLIAVTACAPRAVVIEPIAPKAVAVHAATQRAAASSARVQTAVTQSHKEAQGIAAEANSIAAETDRLRKFPGVPVGEFDALWTMATEHKAHTFAHEIQERSTVATAAENHSDQAEAEKQAGELVPAAKKQDKVVVDQNNTILSQLNDAALGKTVKWMFWIGLVVVLVLGLFALAGYLKLIKRTIIP